MPAVIVKAREAWIAQAAAARDRIEELVDDDVDLDPETSTLDEVLDAHPDAREAVAELLQAMLALGAGVAPNLIARCGLVDVSVALELP
jgi:hypothetical protein